ncbi:DUF4065 domain-containing protein [Leptospira langatensis]|uniref:DUF4065 domain-containing protein n=1 Tax=Leptospira langatensis TaxID=2484983 RepID=A0A5F1ZUJ2_9LEPT|nr:Panacea domain-containing protein [Leptospira langatensis]TGK01329.1 DUF4065 domain-containing protein [Leptospira langatensis]TGL42219.1 DUF4065 domain-containing protein [Leptospira langatensis]
MELKEACKYALYKALLSGNELAKSTLTKVIFLAEYWMAKKTGKTCFNLPWYYDEYGPYLKIVTDSIHNEPDIKISARLRGFGQDTISKFYTIEPISETDYSLDNKIFENFIDEIIESYKILGYKEFINFVYDSYPIRKSERFSNLDLEALAELERQQELESIKSVHRILNV